MYDRVDLVIALFLIAGLVGSVTWGILLFASDTDHSGVSHYAFGHLDEPVNLCRLRPLGRLGWHMASSGDTLFVEDAVFVGNDSAATIQIDEGGNLRLDEQSLVVLGLAGEKKSVDIRTGRVSVTSIVGGLELQLGESSVRIDPGEEVTVYREGETVGVEPKSGEVDIFVGGERLRLTPQNVIEITEGRLTERALEVYLAAPEDTSTVYQIGEQRQEIPFRWSLGREGFILVVSRDRAGTQRVIEQEVSNTEFRVDGLPPGAYTWWIADTNGRPVSAVWSFIVVALRPPECYVPSDAALVVLPTGHLLTLGWTLPTAAMGFRIELASDPSFTQIIQHHQTTDSHWTLSKLAEGTYHWRVIATYRGSQQLTSAPSRFRVVSSAVPDAPNVLRPEVEWNREGKGP